MKYILFFLMLFIAQTTLKSLTFKLYNLSQSTKTENPLLKEIAPLTTPDLLLSTSHSITNTNELVETKGFLAAVEFVLTNENANINCQNKYGATLLHTAIDWREGNIVTALVERGINVHLLDNEGNSALFYALITFQFNIALFLIECDATLTGKEYLRLRKAVKKIPNGMKILIFFNAYHPVIEEEFIYDFFHKFPKLKKVSSKKPLIPKLLAKKL